MKGHWPESQPRWTLPPITGRDLHKAVQQTKKTTAPGLDGWDLKLLPLEAWDTLAVLLTLVEDGEDWPQGLHQAVVTLIPKSSAGGLEEQRPIVLLAVVYRLWARARGHHLSRHLAHILPKEVVGGKPGTTVEDLAHELSMHVAYARNRGLQTAAATHQS